MGNKSSSSDLEKSRKEVFKNRNSIRFVKEATTSKMDTRVDCPLSKGNKAATPKIERPNEKKTKSKFFFKSVRRASSKVGPG